MIETGYKLVKYVETSPPRLISCSLPFGIATEYYLGVWVLPRPGWGNLTVFDTITACKSFIEEQRVYRYSNMRVYLCDYMGGKPDPIFDAYMPAMEWPSDVDPNLNMSYRKLPQGRDFYVLVDPPYGTRYASAVRLKALLSDDLKRIIAE